MDVIVPGPMAGMAWIESEVAKAIKTWSWVNYLGVNPSGFVVTQS